MYSPFRNIWLKLVAMALALLLWLAIAGEPIVERSLRVPLEFQNVPAGLELTGDPPISVDVRLRGPSASLSRLDPGEVMAVVDLRAARPGRRLFHLQPDEVRVPFGIEVANVLPATIPVLLERTGARVAPVVPAVEGDPAPGYVLGRVTSEPPSVEVIGPESRLRQLNEAITEPISIEGRTTSIRETVNVGVPDPALRLAQPRTAVVTVQIDPAPVERVIENVPVRARNLNEGLTATVKPPAVAVRVRGSREAMHQLAPGVVVAYVDLAGLGSGQYNLSVRVDASAVFGTTRIEPAMVDVRIIR